MRAPLKGSVEPRLKKTRQNKNLEPGSDSIRTDQARDDRMRLNETDGRRYGGYSALGIVREDWEARQRAAIGNWNCFGAPAALFCYIDRDMGLPQWADLGMYLQTVMLLLRTEGLHSCPQMAWSQVRETVAEFLSPPDELILYCGMSIGFEDVTVREGHTGRAPLDETVVFVDGLVARLPEGENPKWQSDHT